MEAVASARDMPGDRINRLHLTAKTFGGACIQHQLRTVGKTIRHAVDADHPIGMWSRHQYLRRPRRRWHSTDWQSGREPSLPAAVEHCHGIVPQPAQQPPQTRSECATGIVVGDDAAAIADADATQPFSQCRRIGQRMTAVLSRFRA